MRLGRGVKWLQAAMGKAKTSRMSLCVSLEMYEDKSEMRDVSSAV